MSILYYGPDDNGGTPAPPSYPENPGPGPNGDNGGMGGDPVGKNPPGHDDDLCI